MSFLNKQITFFAFLVLLVPIVAMAQDTGVPDSVIAGNLDGSNIIVSPGDTINIPLWAKNDQDPVLMYLTMAIDDQYIADYFDGNLFDILNPSSTPHWEEVIFTSVLPGRPSVGFSSYPLFCMSEGTSPYDWVPFNSNGVWIKLAEFTFEISDDSLLIGTATQIIEGKNRVFNGCTFLGLPPEEEYHPVFVGGTIEIVEPSYEYLPGDANMSAGVWLPQVIGSDVTYLVNYLGGTAPGCDLNGFYCSGDANGDCQVVGSDVTALMNYTRGLGPISYCEDYPPAWPTSGDLPPSAPEGWPNCDGAVTAKVIPGEPDRK
jgi:hypothetical protein